MSARIVYEPRPDGTPEVQLDALAAVYEFVLRCGEARRAEEKTRQQAGAGKENAGGTSAGDDTKGRSVDDFRAETSIHE